MAFNKNKAIANAQKLAQRGQFDKAVAEYLRVVKEDPHDIRTWLKIGDIYTKMGLRPEATATYQKVAKYYSDRGFHLKAVAVYKQILKLDPTLFQIHVSLAEAYEKLGLVSDAVAQLEEVADAYLNAGRSTEALNVLGHLVSLDPNNVAHHIRLAEYFSRENRKDEAVKHFTTAADMLYKSQRFDDYTKVAERLVFHQPQNLGLARRLARMYLDRRDPKRALSKLQHCFKVDPKDLDTLTLLAEAFNLIGQKHKTVSVYKEMAKIFEERGDLVSRQNVLETIWQMAPDDPEVKAAMKGITGLSGVREEDVDAAEAEVVPEEEIPELYEHEIEDVGEEPAAEAPAKESTKDVERILTETEVFLKYGLRDKAINHIQQIFDIDPLNIHAREKFKDMLVEIGDIENALKQLFYLVDLFTQSQPEASIYYLHEVLRLDPGNHRARDKIVELGGVFPDWLPDQEEPKQPGAKGPSPAVDVSVRDEALSVRFSEEEYSVNLNEAESLLEPETASSDDRGEEGVVVLSDEALEEEGIELHEVRPSQEAASDGEGFFEGSTDDLEDLASPEDLLWDSTPGNNLDVEEEESRSLDPRIFGDPPAVTTVTEFKEDEDLFSLEEEEEEEYILEAGDEEDLEEFELVEEGEEETLDAGEEEGTAEVEAALEEFFFYMQQDLFDEARTSLDEAARKYPSHPLIKNALAQLQEAAASAAKAKAPAPKAKAQAPAVKAPPPSAKAPSPARKKAEEPKKDRIVETAQTIEKDDADTHFDLGIAYKEMGLHAQARKEFELARSDPAREVIACIMMGLCFTAEGNPAKAREMFVKGLASKHKTKGDELVLHYELGGVYLALKDPEKAESHYKDVKKLDPNFRDIQEKLKSVRKGS